MTVNEVSSPDTGPLGLLAGVSLLEGRARRALALAAVGAAAYREAKRWRERWVEAHSYQVTVDGGDEVYPDMQAWLVERSHPSARRSLRVSTRRAEHGDAPVADSSVAPVPAKLRLALDARQHQIVELAGRSVRVVQSLPEWIGQASGVDASRFRDLMQSTFTCPDEASRDAVLDLLADLAARQAKRQPKLHSTRRTRPWRGWPSPFWIASGH